jgi:hypothetical protein
MIVKKIVIALFLIATTTAAVAQGPWAMSNRGRFHGYLTGPKMPKCNPWFSAECARLYPLLFKYVPRPQ